MLTTWSAKSICIYLMLIGINIVIVASCDSAKSPNQGKLLIAASIAPLQDFVQQIGGDRVEVFTIVPAGASPHTFELTTDLMRRIMRSKMLVLNGVGLEYWADKIIDNISRSDFLIIDTSKGIEIIDDEHEASGNPHIWVNPLNAIRQVEAICAGLIQIDPDDSLIYRQKASAFIDEIKSLDQEIEEQVSAWRNKSFVCFHPAWIYFAKRYGLEQAAVIETRPGVEPSPKEMAEIVRTAKRLQVKAIFADVQFSTKTTEVIAEESGASVLVLDPLGAAESNAHYLEMMRHNVRLMATVLK